MNNILYSYQIQHNFIVFYVFAYKNDYSTISGHKVV